MDVEHLFYLLNFIGCVTTLSFLSTGITSFHWVPLTVDAYSTASENLTEQEDCALKSLSQCEDLNAQFCYGFTLDNSECIVFDKPSAKYTEVYSALYNLTNYMNAAMDVNQSCEWNYDYVEVPVDARQTVFDGNHYVLQASTVLSTQCNTECQQMGFDMVSLHSEEQDTFMKDFVKSPPVHLGLCRNRTVVEEKTFYWSDGTTCNYVNWRNDNEPNDKRSNEDCVVGIVEALTSDFAWNDIKCDGTRKQCLCSRPVQNIAY